MRRVGRHWIAAIDRRWAENSPKEAAKWCADNLVNPQADFIARLYLVRSD